MEPLWPKQIICRCALTSHTLINLSGCCPWNLWLWEVVCLSKVAIKALSHFTELALWPIIISWYFLPASDSVKFQFLNYLLSQTLLVSKTWMEGKEKHQNWSDNVSKGADYWEENKTFLWSQNWKEKKKKAFQGEKSGVARARNHALDLTCAWHRTINISTHSSGVQRGQSTWHFIWNLPRASF